MTVYIIYPSRAAKPVVHIETQPWLRKSPLFSYHGEVLCGTKHNEEKVRVREVPDGYAVCRACAREQLKLDKLMEEE